MNEKNGLTMNFKVFVPSINVNNIKEFIPRNKTYDGLILCEAFIIIAFNENNPITDIMKLIRDTNCSSNSNIAQVIINDILKIQYETDVYTNITSILQKIIDKNVVYNEILNDVIKDILNEKIIKPNFYWDISRRIDKEIIKNLNLKLRESEKMKNKIIMNATKSNNYSEMIEYENKKYLKIIDKLNKELDSKRYEIINNGEMYEEDKEELILKHDLDAKHKENKLFAKNVIITGLHDKISKMLEEINSNESQIVKLQICNNVYEKYFIFQENKIKELEYKLLFYLN